MSVRLILPTSALAAAALATTAAFAHPSPSTPPYPDGPAPDMRPEWKGGPEGMPHHHPMPGADMQRAQWEQQRADWLAECRARYEEPRGKHGKTTGAIIGGLAGGVIGNQVAGRGDRVVGTVAGAAIGAVAGAAIGSASDRSRRAERDYCESYLDSYHGGYGQAGYGYPGYSYGYALQPVTMMMPVMMMQVPVAAQPRECKETVVTTEYVTVTPKRRVIYRTVPDKRVRIVPDKRVRTY